MSSLNSLGTPFIELSSVDSTNNYAMGMIRAGMAYHGMAVFAHRQLKGRGQRNKKWISDGNGNIALSIIMEPRLPDKTQMFLLSMAVANGTLRVFNKYADGEALIKWPNDIYWRDRKAAGILIENTWQGEEWKFAVAGIGVNINQASFGESAPRAVSLLQITGKEHDPVLLAKELCASIETEYQLLQKDPAAVKANYIARLYRVNEIVSFKKDGAAFPATIKTVNDLGQLVVQTQKEELLNVGEVEWVI